MKKIDKDGIKVCFLLAFAFIFAISCVSFTSALGERIDIQPSIRDDLIRTGVVISDTAMEYPAVEITGFFDGFLWIEDKKADLVLTEHTAECSEGINCLSQWHETLYSDGALVDNLDFYRTDLGERELRSIRSYQLQYYGDVPDYKTECSPAKLTEEEIKNETKPYDVCVQVESGSHKDWINFNVGDILPAGEYDIRLLGEKAPYMAIDWVATIAGKEIDEWATWGAVMGVGGVNAVVTLNSPADGSVQYYTNVTTNASANVTNGATLTNITLFDNSTGTWGARNTTTISTLYSNKSNPTTPSSTETQGPNKEGMSIMLIGGNQYLYQIAKVAGGTYTKAYLCNSYACSTTYASASFVGNLATFNYYLTNGTTYFLLFDKEGATYTSAYNNGGTYPSESSGVRWIAGYNDDGNTNSGYSRAINYITLGGSVTSATQTFTNTYPSGSNILLNYQVCDSDGDCGFAPQNFTFSIDGTAPTITLNYPTSLIDYGALNQSLQLNFTATDSNLDKIWYNYNGTNVTIVGAVSGVVNLSNITLSTKKNITIYANDTAGNLATQTSSWDYKVFENNRTFNASSVELLDNTYVLNLIDNVNTTSVTLNYDGTDYSATGSGGVYTTTLTSSAVTAITNKTLYWKVVYNNAETINTYSSNQTLQPVIFNICNATINQTLVNFTTRSATNPFPLVNTTFKVAFDYSLSSGGTQKTFNYEDIAGNKSSYAFCSNTNLTIYTNANVEYDANGYALNFYYLTGEETLSTSSSRNISLYLLNDSLATVTQIKVQDSSQRGLNGYKVDVYSYDTGTGIFYLVGMAKTDFNGLDIFYFNWFDTIYKFLVYDSSGNLVKNTGNTKVSNTPVTITLGDSIDFTQDKFLGFTKNLSFNPITNNFVLTFTKPSVLVQGVCLRVDKQNNSGNNKICDTCTNATSATLYCSIGSYGNGTYVAYVYATGSRSILDLLYASIGGEFQDTIYALLGNKDASFYAFLFATLVMLAMFVHPVIGILGLFLGIMGASALGFTSLNWTQFLGIGVVGGIIIWVIKK